MITCRFALILAFEVQTHSTKPRAGFIIRVVVSSLFYRLKCINISSILITFISIGCVTMTFVFSRNGFGMFRGMYASSIIMEKKITRVVFFLHYNTTNSHWNLPPKFSQIYSPLTFTPENNLPSKFISKTEKQTYHRIGSPKCIYFESTWNLWFSNCRRANKSARNNWYGECVNDVCLLLNGHDSCKWLMEVTHMWWQESD